MTRTRYYNFKELIRRAGYKSRTRRLSNQVKEEIPGEVLTDIPKPEPGQFIVCIGIRGFFNCR